MSSSARNRIAWVLQGLLALAFLAAGLRKLTDLPTAVTTFSSLGLPGVLAYVISTAEVLGGIGLVVPRFTRLAAMGLVVIMIGAVVMHITKDPNGLAGGVPALVLLALLGVVLWLRRPAASVVS